MSILNKLIHEWEEGEVGCGELWDKLMTRAVAQEQAMGAVLDMVDTWQMLGETSLTLEQVRALVGPLRRAINKE